MRGSTAFAAAALLLAFLALRLPFLADDLPVPLTGYYQDLASPVFDEGWWTANARERVLSGHFLGTGLDLVWISPVFTAAMTGAFAAFGPTLTAARLAAVLLGAAGLGFLLAAGRGARSPATRRAAVLAVALWTVGGSAAHLGRLALPETAGTTLGLAAAWWLLRRPRAELGAGVLVGLAMLSKPNFAFLLPAFVITAWTMARPAGRAAVPAALRLVAGAAVPLAGWAAFAAAHAAAVGEILAFYDMGRWVTRPPEGVSAFAAGVKPLLQTIAVGTVYRHPVALAVPGIFVLAALAIPRALSGAPRPEPLVRLFAAWALCGGLLVAASPFQPLRYFIPLLPAWTFLAAWFVTPDADRTGTPGSRGAAALRLAGIALLAAQAAYAVLQSTLAPELAARASTLDLDPLRPREFHLTPFLLDLLRTRSLDTFASLRRQEGVIAALVICGALASALGVLVAPFLQRGAAAAFRPGALSPRGARLVAAGLVLSVVLPWIPALRHRARTVADMGEDLARRLPAGSIVAPGGTYALGTTLRFHSGSVRRHARTEPGPGVTHVVALESHPLLGRVPPGGNASAFGARRLAAYALGGGYVYGLYALDPPGAP